MDQINADILIVGGGLTGLTAAYYLKASGKEVQLVESQSRLGGRIKSIGFESNKPLEMGATWLGSQHQLLLDLLHELQLKVFPQVIGKKAIYEAISTSPPYLANLPPNPEPTLRIKGGSMNLIAALAKNIEPTKVNLNTKIEKIEFSKNEVTVFAQAKIFKAKKIITTVPPNLLVNSVEFVPSLPEMFFRIAKTTHTWMSESIKFALRFETPFWRVENLSGTVFSNVGPIPELYDHSNFEDTSYALMGFVNGNYHSLTKEERLSMILNQLRKYFGPKIDNYQSYHEAVWRQDKNIHHPYNSHVLPHQNNGHSIYESGMYDGKLLVSGTESSRHFPGYMEGAVFAAKRSVQFILQNES